MVTLSKFLGRELQNIRTTARQRGAALVEFALVIPLLIAMILGVADLGTAINSYMVLAQIAGEGVRSGSERAGLEQGDNFHNLADASQYPGHYSMQFRVSNLLRMQELGLSNISIDSAFYPASAAAGQRTVEVRISGSYNGLLPIFRNFPMSVEKRGPYLF